MTSNTTIADTRIDVEKGKWILIVATYDESAQNETLTICSQNSDDDCIRRAASMNLTNGSATNMPLQIGGHVGAVHSVLVWNRTLEFEEIQNTYKLLSPEYHDSEATILFLDPPALEERNASRLREICKEKLGDEWDIVSIRSPGHILSLVDAAQKVDLDLGLDNISTPLAVGRSRSYDLRNQSRDVTSIFERLYDMGWNQNAPESSKVTNLSRLENDINVEIDFDFEVGTEDDNVAVHVLPHSLIAFGKRDFDFLFKYAPASGQIYLSRFSKGFGSVCTPLLSLLSRVHARHNYKCRLEITMSHTFCATLF